MNLFLPAREEYLLSHFLFQNTHDQSINISNLEKNQNFKEEKMEAIAKFNYTAKDGTEELSFRKNDILKILNEEEGWYWYARGT